MPNDSTYLVISTKECVKYIQKAGLTIHDHDANLSIKSKSGLVYSLPNNEIVLIPTNFDDRYPGIIFKNKLVFELYSAQDFFPIGEENMTWLERNLVKVKDLATNPHFLSKTLSEIYFLKYPFLDISDVKDSFLKIKALKDSNIKGNTVDDFEDLIYSFGLAFLCYLKDTKNCQLILLKEYENYNPYLYPMLIIDGQKVDVLSKVIRHLKSSSSHSFENLLVSLNAN